MLISEDLRNPIMNSFLCLSLPLWLSLITVGEDATSSPGNCYQGSRVWSCSEMQCVFTLDVEEKHMEREREKYEGGGFFTSDFEVGFSFEKWELRVLFCPRLFLDLLMKKKITQRGREKSLGAFQVWKLRVSQSSHYQLSMRRPRFLRFRV